jgi:hypothetical protein
MNGMIDVPLPGCVRKTPSAMDDVSTWTWNIFVQSGNTRISAVTNFCFNVFNASPHSCVHRYFVSLHKSFSNDQQSSCNSRLIVYSTLCVPTWHVVI